MANPLNWLSKIFRGDQGYSGYADPTPIDPSVFSYESWKDRTLANKQHVGMVPTEVPIPGYAEDKIMYKGQGPGYQPLHERTQTMYVNPALAGTSAYESWYPNADYNRDTGDLSGDLSKKEFLRLNEPLFPPQITNPYPFEPDYAALWAGEQYMERKGDEPAFYDATQMYNDRLADDYADWLGHQQQTEQPWQPGLTLGSYWGDNDKITLNTGLIRGAGPEMMGGSGIDRFGHEQRQEWDAPGPWDIEEPHWRDYMDEVVRHEVKHSAEPEFGRHVPYPKDEEINPMTGMMESAPPGSGAKLHREIYMGDPIWSEKHPSANVHRQGLPAIWEESENVMGMHNYAKNQYLRSQPAERPNMRDVSGPVRSGPSRPTHHFNTGGLASLVL